MATYKQSGRHQAVSAQLDCLMHTCRLQDGLDGQKLHIKLQLGRQARAVDEYLYTWDVQQKASCLHVHWPQLIPLIALTNLVWTFDRTV